MRPDGGAEPTTPVRVEPQDFHQVASHFWATARDYDSLPGTTLTPVLNKYHGAAGVDMAAKKFSGKYLDAAGALADGLNSASNLFDDIAIGLDHSAVNHWRADQASVPGGKGEQSPPWTPVDAGTGVFLPNEWQIPSLVGTLPVGVNLPQQIIDQVPFGSTDALRAIAGAWSAAGEQIYDKANHVRNEVVALYANNSSEDLDAFVEYWNRIGGLSNPKAIITALSDGCASLATACSNFAAWIDEAWNEIGNQIQHAIEQGILNALGGIIGALLLGLITDGVGTLADLWAAADSAGEGDALVAAITTAMTAVNVRTDLAAVGAVAGGIAGPMTAAINTTPNPDPGPANPTTPAAITDDTAETQAENIGDRAGPDATRSSVKSRYDELPAGRNPDYRTVATKEELEAEFKEFTRGGKKIADPTYNGEVYKLPDGTRVSLRLGSKSGGETIDINWGDGSPPSKIHIGGK